MSHRALQEIVAVFGQPVAGNPTQYVMEKAFARAGLDWRYLTIEVAPQDLKGAIEGMRAMGFRGCNLTIPHKVEVIQYLDRTSAAAALMGAVNCVNRQGSELIGENTDGKGFLESLAEIVEPRGKRIVILGAGGAARAIAVELGLAGASRLTIVNRKPARAQPLVELLQSRVGVTAELVPWDGTYEVPPETEILINATSVGLGDPQARPAIAPATLLPSMVVADVVFNPSATRLLKTAQDRGCRTLDGLGMLVNQAAIGFRIWTGIEADREVMRDALDEFLGF